MQRFEKLYIDGAWQRADAESLLQVVNPATEEPMFEVVQANVCDAQRAIAAAHRAFPAWSRSSAQWRRELMLAIADQIQQRYDDFAMAHVQMMGCPVSIVGAYQVDAAIAMMRYYAGQAYKVEQSERRDEIEIVKEPIGVCSFINPWNYPLHQLVSKLAPALAAGCTVVAKPAEQTPLADILLAEICHDVGLPAGVFNVLTGLGSELGPVLCSHPLVDLVSFTGSTASGVKVAQTAAPSVKRVCQELGGKSPYIIASGADLAAAVRYGIEDVMGNSGQICSALTRMFIPREDYLEAQRHALAVVAEQSVGDPLKAQTTMGPVASKVQYDKVRHFITLGVEEGAQLLCGGLERPEGVDKGYFIAPTIFTDVTCEMRIAREEIFGPVLCMIPYDSVEQAIEWANDSPYGLSSAVYASDRAEALAIARQIRAGQCFVQGGYYRVDAPFGGYKRSGNGREGGLEGLAEYLETKAIM